MNFLSTIGIKHEVKIIKTQYENTVKCFIPDPKEAFSFALEKMLEGFEFLSGFPFFYARGELMGYNCDITSHHEYKGYSSIHFLVSSDPP